MKAAKTLVLALGNPLRGDDGAGPTVLEALRAAPLPADVDLLEGGTPGLETVLLLQGYERVLIVDAAEMGDSPGVWRCFSREALRLSARDLGLRGTLHYAGLAEALALGEALGLLPPQLLIYGIQPQEIGWEPGLSPAVAQAIPGLTHAILEELNDGQDSRRG